MKHLLFPGLLATAMAVTASPALAQVQSAYTAKAVHLRAGPARDYPVVAVLPAGFQVLVQGCLSSYTWCDVIAGPDRGWIYAGNINYFYQDTYVPVLNYGPIIGIAVLGFILNDYWGGYYHDRPWYGERSRWIHRRPIAPPPPGFRPIPGRPGIAPRPIVPHRPSDALHPPPPGVRPAPRSRGTDPGRRGSHEQRDSHRAPQR